MVLRRKRKKKRRTTDLRREWTYLPNLITMGRILTIPAILAFIDNYSPVRSFIATCIYLVSGLTDSLDGWLARRRKQVSVLGKFLDPLADKLMVSSVLVYLTAMDRVPPWLTAVLLAREFMVTGLRAIAASEGLIIAAKEQGKQKTALQLIGTMFCLLHFRYPVWGLEHVTIADEKLLIDFHAVGIYTLGLSLVMSIVSGLDYFLGFVRAVQAHAKKSEPPPTAPAQASASPPPVENEKQP
jgi:CDP-diacylglycerol--glycerol-3-phosphate 3-phosphatidyltransferase